MKDFKPDKRKAAMKALAVEVHQKAEKAIELLVDKWIEGAAVLGVLHASFGVRLAYKQELLNQFTEQMMKHPEVFTKEVLESPEFQDGLIVALGSYFKLRTDEKRKLAEKIFYDFGMSHEKPIYPLERYDDTLEKISQSGIRLLGFIHTEIPKVKERYVQAKMYQNSNAANEVTVKTMNQAHTQSKALSFWIEEHVKETAKKNVQKRKDHAVWIADLKKLEGKIRNDITAGISELEQLGLTRTFHISGGWDGGENGYNLTDYGDKFISIIKPDSEVYHVGEER